MMKTLTHADFKDFFQELHGYLPYQWQNRLCEQVLQDGWPDFLNVPTGSGKTSVLEIAVFALAVQASLPVMQRTASTRIFFVIDRRIVVDEADRRAMFIASKLAEARSSNNSIVGSVATALQGLAESDGRNPKTCVPLETHTLRGGFYRTNSWASSLVQPMIVTSTVDQVGSRLLFRGYGVSPTARPLQAALVGTDSTIILDEAHTAMPLGETVDSIRGYQTHAAQFGEASFIKPLHLVQMTATLPPEATDDTINSRKQTVFSLDPAVDLANADSPMVKCYRASKSVKLDVATSAKGKKAKTALAKDLLGRIEKVLEEKREAIGVVVNRVATAKQLYDQLRLSKKVLETSAEVHLMVGAMRPIDRDVLGRLLGKKLGTNKSRKFENPVIVVATQCLEVGADLDFDHMICEAASLDALRQRFGRLNRGGRPIDATGEVVIRVDQDLTEKQIDNLQTVDEADPVYGTSLIRTFQWLRTLAEESGAVNFGLEAMDLAWSKVPIKKDASEKQTYRQQLLINQPDRVALMPAHIDLLSQTYVHFVEDTESAERSSQGRSTKFKLVAVHPDPDVSVFLHGRSRRSIDVGVCWRADLCDVTRVNGQSPRHILSAKADEEMIAAVTEAPPSSAECISVSMKSLKEFLENEVPTENDETDASTVEMESELSKQVQPNRRPVVWRGSDHSFICTNTSELRPGDTLVFPLSAGGWSLLGHIPGELIDPSTTVYDMANEETRANLLDVDVADIAHLSATWKPRLRLYPLLELADIRGIKLSTEESIEDKDWRAVSDRTERLRQFKDHSHGKRLQPIADWLLTRPNEFRIESRASNAGQIAIRTGDRLSRQEIMDLMDEPSATATTMDEFTDETSTVSDQSILLAHHLQSVHDRAERIANAITLPNSIVKQIARAASLHDIGKAEPRFQSTLFGGSVGESWMRRSLLAKSKRSAKGLKDRESDSNRAGLPKSFRHELLSVQLLDETEDSLSDTVMHLIASHHGHARPWFPACDDSNPTQVTLKGIGIDRELSGEDRHTGFDTWTRVAIAERFWRMQRRFGVWGTAYLESILRIADQQVSREESNGFEQSKKVLLSLVNSSAASEVSTPITLIGLDGSNPLALLASLGLLWLLNQSAETGSILMHWEVSDGAWRPVLTGSASLDSAWIEERLDQFAQRSLPNALSLLDEQYQDDGTFAKGAGKVTPSPERFHFVAKQLLAQFFSNQITADQCNFVPSLGSEGTRKKIAGKETDSIEHSQLYMTKGSGHQRMLELMRNVHAATNLSHLQKALFNPWVYDDSGQSLNFRWDPADDRKYALRWKNPSNDPGMTVMGASDLAIESLVYFPTAVVEQRLETTGFEFIRRKGTFWSWPLWTNPLSVDAIRSLLQWSELHFQKTSDTRLSHLGVSVIQRVERKRNDKYFNFSAAESV